MPGNVIAGEILSEQNARERSRNNQHECDG